MAIRIQLRRDTAANWVSSNPVLRQGEMGIETDTLRIKLGDGTSTWTQISAYMNLVPDGGLTVGDYVLVNDIGAAEGVVGLDINKNAVITGSSIIIEGGTTNAFETTLSVTDPTADRTITFKNADGTVAFVADIPTTTDSLTEGSTNKYFSTELAQDAIATALAAGTHTNITVTYDDIANSISLTAAPGYVDEQAVDAVAAALAAGTHTNITVGYNDAGNAISLTGAVTYTDENAQDAIGNIVGTGLSYNDTTGAISVDTSTIQARVANITDTEIGYLDGVTSAIQTQIDAKASSASPTFTGTATLGGTGDFVINGTSNIRITPASGSNAYIGTASSDNIIATAAGLNLKAPIASPTFTGTVAAADLTLSGNLTVNGTTTNLNSTNLVVEDKNIVLGDTATPTDITADGGGITLKGTTDKTINWVDATDAWTLSEHVNLASGKSLYLNGTLLKDATETLTNKTLTSPVINTPTGITKSDVGLANVDNTTDAGKPVSTATQTALDLKAPLASPTFTGTVAGITSTMVGLGSVDNTTDAAKPISTATQTALDLKVDESLFDAKGDLLVASADNTPAKLTVGTNGYLLTANSSATNGVEWAAAPVSLPSQTGESGKYLTTNGSSASWGTVSSYSAPTIGSTSIASGATVTSIAGLKLNATSSTSITANTATTVDTNALSTFTTVKYVVSIKQGSKIRSSEIIAHTDGTSVDYAEFGVVETGGLMNGILVEAVASGSNCLLRVTITNAATTNATVKIQETLI